MPRQLKRNNNDYNSTSNSNHKKPNRQDLHTHMYACARTHKCFHTHTHTYTHAHTPSCLSLHWSAAACKENMVYGCHFGFCISGFASHGNLTMTFLLDDVLVWLVDWQPLLPYCIIFNTILCPGLVLYSLSEHI